MKPLIAPLTVCVSVLCGVAASGQGQAASTMNQEPHHQRLTYIRNMRVFLLTLAPGESTADYLLDHDGAIIALTDATVRLQRAGGEPRGPQAIPAGRADLGQFTGEPVTQRLENAGTAPLRAIVVENLREGKWTMPAAQAAPATTLQQENRSIAVYDMRLNAANARTNHTHQNPTLIFLLSGAVEAQGGGGEFAFPLVQTGTWWFPGSGPDQPHTIELAKGSSEAHVICVEAK
jgi:hypothetical protein